MESASSPIEYCISSYAFSSINTLKKLRNIYLQQRTTHANATVVEPSCGAKISDKLDCEFRLLPSLGHACLQTTQCARVSDGSVLIASCSEGALYSASTTTQAMLRVFCCNLLVDMSHCPSKVIKAQKHCHGLFKNFKKNEQTH
jgi:hypothetical protein